jgi:hypothetical protein
MPGQRYVKDFKNEWIFFPVGIAFTPTELFCADDRYICPNTNCDDSFREKNIPSGKTARL